MPTKTSCACMWRHPCCQQSDVVLSGRIVSPVAKAEALRPTDGGPSTAAWSTAWTKTNRITVAEGKRELPSA